MWFPKTYQKTLYWCGKLNYVARDKTLADRPCLAHPPDREEFVRCLLAVLANDEVEIFATQY